MGAHISAQSAAQQWMPWGFVKETGGVRKKKNLTNQTCAQYKGEKGAQRQTETKGDSKRESEIEREREREREKRVKERERERVRVRERQRVRL